MKATINRYTAQENILYLIIWLVFFAAPVFNLFVRAHIDHAITFEWDEIWPVWLNLSVFLTAFLIHNFLIAPLLIYRRKTVLYIAIAAVLVLAFVALQCSDNPMEQKHRFKHRIDMADGHLPPPHDGGDTIMRPGAHGPGGYDRPPLQHGHWHRHPPVDFHDMVAFLILMFSLGTNLGVKHFFKTQRDKAQHREAQQESMAQQLEYLRYQINPHFFMNTLNNIHALVDIDSEKAKSSILELSKMMRYVLYDADKPRVPLAREQEFINHYMTLMALRYTDKVQITLDLPAVGDHILVAPLLFIPFVENAFKHGVSYRQPSFIEVRLNAVNDRINFSCRNSKVSQPIGTGKQRGGVGLANVKKRLQLIYGDSCTLTLNNGPDTYEVKLTLPADISV